MKSISIKARSALLSVIVLIGIAVFFLMEKPIPDSGNLAADQASQQDGTQPESPGHSALISDSETPGDGLPMPVAADSTADLLLPSQVVGKVFPGLDLDGLARRLPREQFAVFERLRKELPKVDWTEIEPTHQAFLDKLSEFPLNLNDHQREVYAAWIAEVEPMSQALIELRAEAHGLSAKGVQAGQDYYIHGFRNGVPVYVVTTNVGAAITTGASYIRLNSEFDPVIGGTTSGSEFYVNVNDGGQVSEHAEFQLPDDGGSRIMLNTTTSISNHATHVAGTISAWGYNPNLQGMAPRSWIRAFQGVNTAPITNFAMAQPGQLMGINNPRTGNPQMRTIVGNTSMGTQSPFNRYNSTSALYDNLLRNHPYYMHFNSSGNSGASGYESLTGAWKIAKNIINIGNVNNVTRDANGNYVSGGNIAGSSSRGPTYDGRISPDFVGKGTSVLSTRDTSASATSTGTSMAAPNVAGSVTLLMDYVRQRLPQQYLRSSTYRALLATTADDRGNPGPDYIYGWGILNVHAAAKIVRQQAHEPLQRLIVEDTLAPNDTWTETYSTFGSEPIRVTISWLDPGSSNTDTNSRASRIVNDLDLRLIGPDGTEHMPYVMPFTTGQGSTPAYDPSLYAAHAVPGDNTTDAIEQVYLAAPAGGSYTVRVTHKGNLLNNEPQPFSVAVSGLSSVFDPNALVLFSITPENALQGTTVPVVITGANLSSETEVKLENPGEPDIFLTSREMIGDALHGVFTLTGVASGPWSVTATNPDSQTATLSRPFTVDPLLYTIWSENFDASTSLPPGWSSTATDASLGWSIVTDRSHTPGHSAFAVNPIFVASQYLISPEIPVPADGIGMRFSFWHHYELESGFDGGRIEFSLDGGDWFGIEDADSGASFASNGYTSTISTGFDSPIGGQSAWSGNSGGFVQTVIDITDEAKYAGKTLRARWHLASDSSIALRGWNVDTVEFTAEEPRDTPGLIRVTPLQDFTASGSLEGPFSPTSREYTLRNPGNTTIEWAASKTGDWADISTTSGTLEPGAETTVTISLNALASTLGINSYDGSVSFTNTTDGRGDTSRSILLNVNPFPVEVTLDGLTTTYDGSPKPVSVTTHPSGMAYSLTYDGLPDPPTDAGEYEVVVIITEPNHAGGAVGILDVAKAAQTITFAPLDNLGINDDPVPLSATSSTGLPVSFTSSSPSVASISDDVLTPVAIGTTVITASQPGNGNFEPAPEISQNISVIGEGQIAAGGEVTFVDGFYIHTFTENGTFEVPDGTTVNVEVLVVGGGGGGGTSRNFNTAGAGGGGAGGLIHQESFQVTNSIDVLIGSGGAATSQNFEPGSNGGQSVFGSLVALGGGGGSSANAQGEPGGSGGGSRGNANGGAGQQPSSTSGGFGNSGGGWTSQGGHGAGGGGGAGGAAPSAPPHDPLVGGPGGIGLEFNISGSPAYYAGGGGGGGSTTSAFGVGGSDIGGSGANNGTPATPGAPNTGGGGGGGNNNRLGADGGSGIVIVRYPGSAEPAISTITFDANGGTAANPADKEVTFGEAYGTLATTSRPNHSFVGWFTAAEGGTQVTETTVVTIAGNHTLYAQWSPDTYTVTYNGNGNTSGEPPAPQEKIHGIDLTILGNTGNLVKSGHAFVGWNTEPDGSGTDYPADSTYTANAPVTLHAKWIEVSAIIYEPFDQTAGSLAGKIGGQGLIGNWAITQTVNVVNPSNLGYGDLANTGGQADMASGSGTFAHISTGSGLADAGLLDHGATLWFSYVFQKTSGGGTNEHSGFAFGTDRVDPAFSGLNIQNSGSGLGIYSRNTSLTASSWSGGSRTAGSDSASLTYSEPVLVIGKIEWGATPVDDDTITIWTRALDDIDTEPTTGGSTRITAALDQTTFTTISFGLRNSGGIQTYDEIRFGATYADVTPAPSGVSLASFAITGMPAHATIGTPIDGITITALDANEQPFTGFSGTVSFGGSAGITGQSAPFVEGVLSGVSITPTVVGTDLTFTVSDGEGNTGEAVFTVRSLFQAWGSQGGAGGGGISSFGGDSNGSGIAAGIAWLLGAASPEVGSADVLPDAQREGNALKVEFHYLAPHRRGNAGLSLEYSETLAAESWTRVEIPADLGEHQPGNGVSIHVHATADPGMHRIEATVPAAASGRVFLRLRGVEDAAVPSP